ncbi:hypothetical protein J4G48_0040490 [Bradyrhizobium barranii subsp. apii]|uniref:hypothetical protein n=1 Tax=Bradyrhizobium barranii TaxID=2992140 RepID=UPI001AA149AD|nr:hypothetical protein [Bradyrhizobium barranii]UPT95436.1 hypothetical protein J4G48_0040490 [Bradyrhizobium barranii subsp. apii]
MSYSPCDYMDDVNAALNVDVDDEDVSVSADAALAEIERLQAIEKAHKAAPATTMERMLYLVGPIGDHLDWDNDGPVSRDLFVWAADASEAVKLWREYYDLSDDEDSSEACIGITDKVRVFEVPIMPNAATSTAIKWDDIYVYGATITERVEI